MLTEHRHNAILQLVNGRGSITVAELKKELGISESTVRRDITALASQGKLEKVFGGALSLRQEIVANEPTVAQKSDMHKEEKLLIGKYAAALLNDADFVYIDAGTTTFSMLEFIPDDLSCSFVTNGVSHARELAASGKKVILVGGALKDSTEAVVGNAAVLMLQSYHFTKGFFGANGISGSAGFTTPDAEEAIIKQTAMAQCRNCYVLSDSSKFGVISSVTFYDAAKARILTNEIPEAYKSWNNITKV